MSIWSDINRFLSTLVLDTFATVVEGIRTVFSGNAETRKRVAFSVALITLSAKMAKADGVVTADEVGAFQDIFKVPENEFKNVARLYNLAKQDIAGYDAYARQVRSLFPGDEAADQDVLRDVLDALFHIAKADDYVHEKELAFLQEIAMIFGFNALAFERIKARHLLGEEQDPYVILEADANWDFDRLKAHYRKRVAENHPDRFIARGVPPEFITIASARLAAINAAWEQVKAMHQLPRRLG